MSLAFGSGDCCLQQQFLFKRWLRFDTRSAFIVRYGQDQRCLTDNMYFPILYLCGKQWCDYSCAFYVACAKRRILPMFTLMAIRAQRYQVFRFVAGLFPFSMMRVKRPRICIATTFARKTADPDNCVSETQKPIVGFGCHHAVVNGGAPSGTKTANVSIHLLATEHQISTKQTRLSLNTFTRAIFSVFASLSNNEARPARSTVTRYTGLGICRAFTATIHLSNFGFGVVTKEFATTLWAFVHASIMGAL